jgi:hypothetical protein
MIVIIAGSRHLQDPHQVEAALAASDFTVSEVVSGACRGVDQLGEAWARARQIPVRCFPADWRLGRRAGPVRNETMIRYAAAHGGALVAIWDGLSPGTAHSIRYARQLGLAVHVHLCPSQSCSKEAIHV